MRKLPIYKRGKRELSRPFDHLITSCDSRVKIGFSIRSRSGRKSICCWKKKKERRKEGRKKERKISTLTRRATAIIDQAVATCNTANANERCYVYIFVIYTPRKRLDLHFNWTNEAKMIYPGVYKCPSQRNWNQTKQQIV